MNLKVVTRQDHDTEALATVLVDCAFQIHKAMGPGLLERVYEECFKCELTDRSISFECQKSIPLQYKTHKLDIDYKIDLLVDNKIVVELKSVDRMIDLHQAQIVSYMRLTGMPLGLLINFNVPLIKDGIKRIVL